ncbi:MAG: iron-containing alcohol dehydrogenase, partial [Bdellovibrionales bacterium]|nr:iron-containing alcohol dehydrogenase [Bdellovibrionales bacterium]
MIKQYNFPTTILFGRGAVEEAAQRIYNMKFRKPLLVADQGLVDLGIVDKISKTLHQANLEPVIFTEVHPNPIEDDVLKGASYYLDKKCDCVIALGGGSPMDAAKGIMIATTHEGPLAQYDDAIGGDKLLVNPMPKLFAIPTTAGTGSEVGRCGVITLKETNNKTIFFHPTLLPTIAILEPELTLGLPKSLTVATGIDAFTHSLEAYLAPGFHPLADGIALESMRLVIENLPLVATNGHDIVARGKMMMAALMGATAFQKGLGMIHSLAHPLSSECGLHHGLANALVG